MVKFFVSISLSLFFLSILFSICVLRKKILNIKKTFDETISRPLYIADSNAFFPNNFYELLRNAFALIFSAIIPEDN